MPPSQRKDDQKNNRTFEVKPPFSGVFMICLRVLMNLGSDWAIRRRQSDSTKKTRQTDLQHARKRPGAWLTQPSRERPCPRSSAQSTCPPCSRPFPWFLRRACHGLRAMSCDWGKGEIACLRVGDLQNTIVSIKLMFYLAERWPLSIATLQTMNKQHGFHEPAIYTHQSMTCAQGKNQ